MGKKRAIIFGASEGGKNFIKHQKDYEIVGIADNDIRKHGSQIEQHIVIAPAMISSYDFDFVVITSMYVQQIYDQLVIELRLDPRKVLFPPKNLLKTVIAPFEDEETREFARSALLFISREFAKRGIRYFVDFGTLLGIVRDYDLIAWDDDIDISVISDDIDKVVEFIKSDLPTFESEKIMEWTAHVIFNEQREPVSVQISFKDSLDNNLKKFHISIGIIHFKNQMAFTSVNSAPETFFLRNEVFIFKGEELHVPYGFQEYLQYTYGDWKVPRKNTSFMDNALSFREPERTFSEKVL